MNKKTIAPLATGLMVLLLPVVVFANPCSDIQGILTRILNILDGIIAGVSAIVFAWAGLLYLTARGDTTKIASAHKMLIWGAVGVAVFLLSETIPGWVSYIVGISANCI